MRLTDQVKRGFVVGAIAIIPLWYTYRSFGEHRPVNLDEMMTDEPTRLKKELEAAKVAASEPVRRHQAELEIEECLKLVAEVRSFQTRLDEERNAVEKERDELLSSIAGAAIAGNADYVRAFREFAELPYSVWELEQRQARVNEAEASCRAEAKNPPTYSSVSLYKSSLESARQFYSFALGITAGETANLMSLARLASGQPASTLQDAVNRQRVAEAAEQYRTRRKEDLFNLSQNYMYPMKRMKP